MIKQTQLVLLKSQFVLTSVLNRRDIAKLNAVVSRRPDELAWLQNKLQVSFPGEGDIMMIRYEGEEDPKEMKKIIDAVVHASMEEVVASDGMSDTEKARSLEHILKKLEVDLQRKTKKHSLLREELEAQASQAVGREADTIAGSSVPSKPQGMLNADIEVLQKDIAELEAMRHQLLLRIRKIRTKEDTSEKKIRVLQNAFSTPKTNSAQRYTFAALGAAATFVLTCLVVSLIGKYLGTRDATP